MGFVLTRVSCSQLQDEDGFRHPREGHQKGGICLVYFVKGYLGLQLLVDEVICCVISTECNSSRILFIHQKIYYKSSRIVLSIKFTPILPEPMNHTTRVPRCPSVHQPLAAKEATRPAPQLQVSSSHSPHTQPY